MSNEQPHIKDFEFMNMDTHSTIVIPTISKRIAWITLGMMVGEEQLDRWGLVVALIPYNNPVNN